MWIAVRGSTRTTEAAKTSAGVAFASSTAMGLTVAVVFGPPFV